MYIPKPFKVEDWKEIVAFVEEHPAINLITVGNDGGPRATLLPCVWDTSSVSENNYGTLVTHISRGNPQWKEIVNGQVALAIVQGPQAYISPSNYSNKQTDHKVVPTWNYQVVQLRGTLKISEDVEELRKIVSELTHFHESQRSIPWSADEANPAYIEAQLKGIVAITMHVTQVEAAYKLSQNRSKDDQRAVANDLATSLDFEDHAVAAQMQRNLNQL